ncbi:MAG: hypothetical protein LIO95_03350, partial [Clostridiales bacterium]|nr:hypothetical protein [Clostridiales bacterium]
SVSSDPATITLGATLAITSQPEDVTVQAGKEVSFTVEATGTDLSYQWYYKKAGATSWSIWNNHTTATTSATANSSWDGMQVYCVVTDGNGNSVSSDPATITLNG